MCSIMSQINNCKVGIPVVIQAYRKGWESTITFITLLNNYNFTIIWLLRVFFLRKSCIKKCWTVTKRNQKNRLVKEI